MNKAELQAQVEKTLVDALEKSTYGTLTGQVWIDKAEYRTFLLHALHGVGVPGYGEPYVTLGFAEFSGNQHNEAWRWVGLDRLTTEQLRKLYDSVKGVSA